MRHAAALAGALLVATAVPASAHVDVLPREGSVSDTFISHCAELGGRLELLFGRR